MNLSKLTAILDPYLSTYSSFIQSDQFTLIFYFLICLSLGTIAVMLLDIYQEEQQAKKDRKSRLDSYTKGDY